MVDLEAFVTVMSCSSVTGCQERRVFRRKYSLRV